MTHAPEAERLAFASYDEVARALRERGLRMSTSRRLVLEALFSAGGPVSADRMATSLDLEPGSVYRNLETLERHGLVRHVHLGHGAGLYMLVGAGEREYLYCERCGAARAVQPEELDPVRDQIRALFGHRARFTHFAIVGSCEKCSRPTSSGSHRASRPTAAARA